MVSESQSNFIASTRIHSIFHQPRLPIAKTIAYFHSLHTQIKVTEVANHPLIFKANTMCVFHDTYDIHTQRLKKIFSFILFFIHISTNFVLDFHIIARKTENSCITTVKPFQIHKRINRFLDS